MIERIEFLDCNVIFASCIAWAWSHLLRVLFSTVSCCPAFAAKLFLRDDILLKNDNISPHCEDLENTATVLNSKSGGGPAAYQAAQAITKGCKGIAGGMSGIMHNEGMVEVPIHHALLYKAVCNTLAINHFHLPLSSQLILKIHFFFFTTTEHVQVESFIISSYLCEKGCFSLVWESDNMIIS